MVKEKNPDAPITEVSKKCGEEWRALEKVTKMDDEVKKWSRKDPMAIKKAMVYPDTLEALERGEMIRDYNQNTTNLDSEDEDDPRTPTSVSSQGSQGYESTGSDFVELESFTSIPD